jgi:hypothetical protein
MFTEDETLGESQRFTAQDAQTRRAPLLSNKVNVDRLTLERLAFVVPIPAEKEALNEL